MIEGEFKCTECGNKLNVRIETMYYSWKETNIVTFSVEPCSYCTKQTEGNGYRNGYNRACEEFDKWDKVILVP